MIKDISFIYNIFKNNKYYAYNYNNKKLEIFTYDGSKIFIGGLKKSTDNTDVNSNTAHIGLPSQPIKKIFI